jgi:hypothetical protein
MISLRALVVFLGSLALARGQQCSAGYAWDGAACVLDPTRLDQCRNMSSYCACRYNLAGLAITESSSYNFVFTKDQSVDGNLETFWTTQYTGIQYLRFEAPNAFFVAGGYVFTQTKYPSLDHADENYEVWIGNDRNFPGYNKQCFRSHAVNFKVEEFTCGSFGRFFYFGRTDPNTTSTQLAIAEAVVYAWNGNSTSSLVGNAQCTGVPVPFSNELVIPTTSTSAQVLPGSTSTTLVELGTTTTTQAQPGTTTTTQAQSGTTSTTQAQPGTTTTTQAQSGTTSTTQAQPGSTTTTQAQPGTTSTTLALPGSTTTTQAQLSSTLGVQAQLSSTLALPTQPGSTPALQAQPPSAPAAPLNPPVADPDQPTDSLSVTAFVIGGCVLALGAIATGVCLYVRIGRAAAPPMKAQARYSSLTYLRDNSEVVLAVKMKC